MAAETPAEAPASVTQALGAAAPPAEIRHGDRVYKVGAPTQAAKACLEQLVAQEARRTILEYGGTRADWLDRVEAGDYATFAPGWVRVTRTPAAGALYLLALMKPFHPDLTPAEVQALADAEPDQVRAAVTAHVPDFFARLAAGAGVPPAQAAALAAKVLALLSS